MNTYKIELSIKKSDETSFTNKQDRWYGYTEQMAIAQAFLYHAQAGARSIEVLSIELIKTN